LPTIFDVLDIPIPLHGSVNKIAKESLFPLFMKSGNLPKGSVFWRTHCYYAVRSGEWKMIVSKQTEQMEFINLTKDVREAEIDATKFPETFDKFISEFDVWKRDVDFKQVI